MISTINKFLPLLAIVAILIAWLSGELLLPVFMVYTAITAFVLQIIFGALEYKNLRSQNKNLTAGRKVFVVLALVFYVILYVWGGIMSKALYGSLIDMV